MKLVSLFCFIATVVFAQDAVKRPSVPSDSTLAAPTSQIAAWYRYAVYVEGKLAAAQAEIDQLKSSGTVDAGDVNTRLAQIEAKLNFISSSLRVERVLVAPTQDKVTITWQHDGQGITGFVIERSTNGKDFVEVGRVGVADRVFRQLNVPAGTYWYRVRAFNGTVLSDASNIVSIEFGGS
jgi:hypothetical protein